ncbi:MAG: hypothetical protein PHV68_04570 [Candidatus Gastranaerophilales bacterium]|nr:hypothetical protein [Candidatus Gastranaerophilales bacterium]
MINFNTYSKISFGTIETSKKILHESINPKTEVKNCTLFFRSDMNWEALSNYIIANYPEGTPIYNFACSDGTEPYSLRLMLNKKMKEQNLNKNYPINAIDIDKENIERAKTQKVGFGRFDGSVIPIYLGEDAIDENFKLIPNQDYDENYKVSDELFKSINFQEGDIKMGENS